VADRGARAAIDISDGLVGDAMHIAFASDVRIELMLDRLPVLDGVTPEDAARSGEEYELIIATPAALDTAAFASQFGIPLTEIGRVSTGAPGVDATVRGRRVSPPSGFSHFAP
jgi:thiamine-monophosphate kinase